jgi:hypothetical protein
LDAKAYFTQRLREKIMDSQLSQEVILERYAEVVDSVLSCKWVYFPLSLGQGATDGTDDLCIIFQRLARHGRGFRPRPAEGVDIGEGDLVRSLLLGSFRNETDAISMYQKHWMVVEQAAQATALAVGRPNEIGLQLENLLHRFIDREMIPAPSQPRLVTEESVHAERQGDGVLARPPKRIKFQTKAEGLHSKFCKWLESSLIADAPDAKREARLVEPAHVEHGACMALEKLSAFATSISSATTESLP